MLMEEEYAMLNKYAFAHDLTITEVLLKDMR